MMNLVIRWGTQTLRARRVRGSERGRLVLVTVDMLNHDREDAKVPGAEAT